MTDAVKVVARFGLRYAAVHRIEAACIPDNARSIRVLEKPDSGAKDFCDPICGSTASGRTTTSNARSRTIPGAGTKD